MFAMVTFVLFFLVVIWSFNLPERWKFRHIPGPAPSPLLGNMIEVGKQQMYKAQQIWQAQYGDIFSMFAMRKPIVVVADPVAVRQIMVKETRKFHQGWGHPLIMGQELEAERSMMVFAEGGLWTSLRAGAAPMFHTQALTSYAAVINKAVDTLLGNLAYAAEADQEVDIFKLLGSMTMEVIGKAAFGVDFDCQKASTDNPLVKATATMFETNVATPWILAVFMAPTPFVGLIKRLAQLFPSKTDAQNFQANRYMFDVSASLVQNSQKALGLLPASTDWLWFKRNPNNPYTETVPDENSIIPVLLKANNKASGTPLTSMQVNAQTKLFIAAGYETTALALVYSIYLLSKSPKQQAKLLQEVDAFNDQIEYRDLQHFPYTAAVINESLRLFPPAVMVPRNTAEDVKLGPYNVPKRTEININIWCVHHDERWWEDAEAFKPERWVGDPVGGDKTGGLAYLPFGSGPRLCVGYKLALEEATIALARLYQKYTFRLCSTEPLQLLHTTLLSPKGGLPVKILSRQFS